MIGSNKESGQRCMMTIPSNVLHCYFLFSPWKPPDWRIGGLSGFFAFSLENMEKALLPMPYLYLYAFSKNIVHELCRIVYSFSAFILLWCSHKRKAKTAGLLHYQSMFIIVFSSSLFSKGALGYDGWPGAPLDMRANQVISQWQPGTVVRVSNLMIQIDKYLTE